MSVSQETSWSDNPNAPNTSLYVYFGEKVDFAGTLIYAILYGMPKTPHP